MKLWAIIIFMLSITILVSQIPVLHQVSNSKGNISIIVSNDGSIANDIENMKSGFVWPKGSKAQYIFGGGFVLFTNNNDNENKLAEFSYDPNAAKSWFSPGIIADGDSAISSLASKYRVYSSRNYDNNTGKELFGGTGLNWPIWTKYGFIGANYGGYIEDAEDRSNDNRNIKIISDEDLVSIYKDTDENANSGINVHPSLFPKNIEAETRVYCYEDEQKKDMVYVNWILTNRNDGELERLNFAPIFDIDITKTTNSFAGIDNDQMETIDNGKIATFSTEISNAEKDQEFGYLSFKWIRLPYVTGRNIAYGVSESNKLVDYGMIQIPANVDIYSTEFADLFDKSDITLTGDQRFFMPTGEFDLLPNQSVSFVIAISMTGPNEDYPSLDDDTKSEIVANMKVFDDFFNDKVSSVDNVSISDGIGVFPNPTKGVFSLKLDFQSKEAVTFQLYNLKGEMLRTLVPSKVTGNEYQFSVKNLPPSIYIINISHGTEERAVKVVVE